MKNIDKDFIRWCLVVSTATAAIKLVAIEVTTLIHTLAGLFH
jgi:hypothetical protein